MNDLEKLAKVVKETKRIKTDEGLNWIAHRGNNTEYPENSIMAFQTARRHWGIETDIQVTSDGKWVVMHDSTVDRTTNGTGTVASKTLAQFRSLRIDTGANINTLSDTEKIPPTLEEFLLVCKELAKVPILDIRTANYTNNHYDSLKDALSLFGYDETNCVISSYDYAVLAKVRKLYPRMELHYFVNSIDSNVINQIIALGSPAACSCTYSSATFTATNVKLLHAAGLKVGARTVPDASFDSMKKLGVDYITTDSLSGNLRYAALTLQNGFINGTDSGRIKESFVQEIGGGLVKVSFNVTGGVNTQNSVIASLPKWATPMYREYNQCSIRKSTGAEFGTFDLNGRLVPGDSLKSTIGVGLNWGSRTTWAAGSAIYKI